MFFVFSYSLLIGQVFAFCNFIFRVYDTVCDWSKTLILKQLHFSFFLANHIKTNLCCHANLCRKNMFDYRRHLQMQESDCVVNYIFPSTSTLLNPMRHSSQNFVGRVALCEKQDFESIMSRIRSHAELFFAHFVSILVLFVSVIR